MRALLDTQILYLAAGLDISHFRARVRTLLEDPQVDLLISTASLMEIAIKGIFSEAHTRQACTDLRLTIIPFNAQHTYRLFTLPLHHRDPFDRMLIATALVENTPIVGADKIFKKYKGLTVIW